MAGERLRWLCGTGRKWSVASQQPRLGQGKCSGGWTTFGDRQQDQHPLAPAPPHTLTLWSPKTPRSFYINVSAAWSHLPALEKFGKYLLCMHFPTFS